jgi:hypothetical protein
MNRLTVAALVVTPFIAAQVCRAAEQLEGALSLNLGSCWVRQESAEPRWKLVSFSDRVASNLGANEFQQTLNQPISTVLQGAFSSFPPSATDTYYRCTAAGHFFWTSIPDGPVPLCAWSRVLRNPDNGQLALTLLDVYPDHEYRQGVPCNGAERRSLIIVINSGSDIQAVMAHLRTHKRYEGVFADLMAIGSTTIIARLEIAYDFRENVIKELIETDKLLDGDLNIVQYDGRLSISGESFRLFSGNYPGY